MMFMIPTPPTSSEMPTMPAATMVIVAGDGLELVDELLRPPRPGRCRARRTRRGGVLRRKNVDLGLGFVGDVGRAAGGHDAESVAAAAGAAAVVNGTKTSRPLRSAAEHGGLRRAVSTTPTTGNAGLADHDRLADAVARQAELLARSCR